MDPTTLRRRVLSARVARLATVDGTGRPHLVPVCFALVGDTVYSAVDHKPKRSGRLRRTENVEATGVACLLVDHYDDDWSRLWWVRLDGRGRVVDDADERARALEALGERYRQYREIPPVGTVLAVDVTGWRGWSAS